MNQPAFPLNINQATRMHDDGMPCYWFYHKDSFPSDPPLVYRQLVCNAKSTIEVWDPHINVPHGPIPVSTPNDMRIFDNVQPRITIKILTQKGMTKGRTFMLSVESALKALVPATLDVRFGLRVIQKGAGMDNWIFHDRMLIIDSTDFYVVGSSIGWHLEPEGSTGIFRIRDEKTRIFMRQLFDSYWIQAKNCEIPVKNLHLI